MFKEIMAQNAFFCETNGSAVTVMQTEVQSVGPFSSRIHIITQV